MKRSWRIGLLETCLLSVLFLGRCEAASTVELNVQLEQTSMGASARLSWNSIPGERYEIVATHDLITATEWQPLELGPLAGDGALLEVLVNLDFERPSGFFQVLAFDNDSVGQAIQDGLVLPTDPYVTLGNPQSFSVSFPGGGVPTWSLFGLESMAPGSIGESGVYVAPTQEPELPFVGILAQNTSQPDRFSASTAILVPPDEIRISRNQAIEILQRTVIDSHPRKSELLALGLHEPIGRADELRVYDPNRKPGQSEVAGSAPCWFFLVDEDPTSSWMHPVRYVKIDCRSGDLLQNEPAFWYPELNGQPFWNRVKDRESVRDRVFVGETVVSELEEEELGLVEVDLNGLKPLQASPRQRALVPLADEFIPIPRMFPGVANACNCPDTRRRHALIGVMSPEEDRLLVSGNDWESLFQKNAYTTTLVSDGSASKVRKQLDEWRTTVRPCDVVVVMLLGHGIQGSVSGMSSSELIPAFRLIPTGAKYLVMESCDAGHVFDIFKKHPLTPRVEILTATDKVDPDSKIQFTGTSPLIVAFTSQSGFTRALMACFSRFDTLSEAHKCLTNASDIGPAALRMKIAGPRLERVGGPDKDQDGILDEVEMAMGLNPGSPDSDGDGVCDGIEYGQTATLELRFGNNRGDRFARGKKKPEISSSSAPPRVLNGEIYRLQLFIKGGVPIRPGLVSFSNPFGLGPQNGFFIDQGALPEGITLDRETGLIQGSPRSFGSFNFTVRYVDAIGVKATRSFEMRTVNVLGTTGRVRVSSNGDGNERDDHITLREAVLLCTGKLSQDALKEDPNPEDDVFEGEKRWITGEFGAPFQNTIVFEDPMTIDLTEGPLVFDTHASTLVMGEKRIRIKAGTGPVFDFQGDRNTLQDIAFISVSSGTAIRISGQGNYIGEAFSLWQHPSLVIQGGGTGTGVEVTGMRNTLASFSIQGFTEGLLLKDGAAYNTIDSMRCGKNRTGIELLGGANHNRIFDCLMGLEFAETVDHLPKALANREHGLVIRGGSQFNMIEACGMAANGMNGILVDGETSDSNVFRGLQIGSAQEFRGVGGMVAANGGNGIEFANGASENVIQDCVLSENIGNGILLSGAQTENNLIGGSSERPVKITQSSATGDAILIKDGASGNEVAVTIAKSGRGGVILSGKETSDNRITCRKYSTVLGDFIVPSEISNCVGAGIFIGEGATDSVVEEWTRVENCGSGIVIDGPGTKDNCVQEVVIKNASTNGIQLSNRAQNNLLGPDLIVQGSGQNGVLITGSGTDFNWLGDSFKLSEIPHGRYAVEITRGAKSNTVTRCSVFSYRLGGFALTGGGTDLNRIVENEIRNQIAPDSGEDVPGILIASGASRNLILDNEIGSGKGDGLRISGASSQGNIVNRNGVHGFTGDGIRIDDSPGNIIGSTTGGGNSIDDNRGAGIRIRGTEAKGNRVMSNNIGNTSFRPGNGSHGIAIEAGAAGNRIGGVRPVFRELGHPGRRLAADPEQRGAANVIVGNGGNGVHIDGASGNQVLGNIIGSKKIGFFLGDFGNQGAGIQVTGGAESVCIGNCVSLADRAIGFGNIISHNHGAGILISGSETSEVSVRENNVYSNDGGRVVIEENANDRIKLPELSIEPGSNAILGMATRRGYIEFYSDEEGQEGTYHMTAVVGRGAFRIDRFEPRIRSQNALILQEELELPTGKVSLNFTDFQSGNSTVFIDLE